MTATWHLGCYVYAIFAVTLQIEIFKTYRSTPFRKFGFHHHGRQDCPVTYRVGVGGYFIESCTLVAIMYLSVNQLLITVCELHLQKRGPRRSLVNYPICHVLTPTCSYALWAWSHWVPVINTNEWTNWKNGKRMF